MSVFRSIFFNDFCHYRQKDNDASILCSLKESFFSILTSHFSLCLYVCMCLHVCVYVCMCVCVCVCLFMCAFVCICVHICLFTASARIS